MSWVVRRSSSDPSRVEVDVREEDGALTFTVSDDGTGFDVHGKGMGAGFTNMLDRLGALGSRERRWPSRGHRGTERDRRQA